MDIFHGQVPSGRGLVEGAYKNHGAWLFHAVTELNGVKLPGMTETRLVCFPCYIKDALDSLQAGSKIGYYGFEHTVPEHRDILYDSICSSEGIGFDKYIDARKESCTITYECCLWSIESV